MKSYLSMCLKHQQAMLLMFCKAHDCGNKVDIVSFHSDSTQEHKYKYFS